MSGQKFLKEAVDLDVYISFFSVGETFLMLLYSVYSFEIKEVCFEGCSKL